MTVPQAVISSVQGLGRLIRTRNDRGSSSFSTSAWSRDGTAARVLAALPPARVEQGDSVEVFRAAREFLSKPATG